MSDRAIAPRTARILKSLEGFLAAISDPELAAAILDPEVCDFVAGNPQELASREYVEALLSWTEPQDKNWFGYKAPHRPAQVAAAEGLTKELGIEFDPDDIVLTRGAHGALGQALGAVVDPGDEVIYVSPPWFFYEALILGAGGEPVRVGVSPETFELDLDAIRNAITPRTRVLLINTPHNPTGRIYRAETLQALAVLLRAASEGNGRPIYIVSDESYSRILFDGNRMVTPASYYPWSLLVHTYSKSALAPGQRLGYLALPPEMPQRQQLRLAFIGVGVSTGNFLPDAIMQYALSDIEHISIDMENLQEKRDRMLRALLDMGYDVRPPEATFYLLPRSPIEDDVQFTRLLARERVLVLPGRALELPGYFRISLTATDDMIDRSLPVFADALARSRAT